MRLETGQVAVVTGGAGGLGRALAGAFARRGLDVVLADVERGALDEARSEVAAAGANVLAVEVDVSDGDAVGRLASATIDRFGRVDVVCNNAGVNARGLATWEFELSDWQWLFGVNLWGVIHGIRAFVPLLVERGSGHVVNTASMAGLMAIPGIAPYNATKHAVVAITETLRAELDALATGVGASVLCPSFMKTGLARAERNRPAELAVTRTTRDTFELGTQIEDVADLGTQEPQDVADLVVASIEENRLHVCPDPGTGAAARRRFDRVLADLR
jgi:NAD(P)-dependent dehydrogenase (short-subunit alcohol dehydrogenase family)